MANRARNTVAALTLALGAAAAGPAAAQGYPGSVPGQGYGRSWDDRQGREGGAFPAPPPAFPGWQGHGGGPPPVVAVVPVRPSEALRRLQEATQELREAIQAMTRQAPGPDRDEALRAAELAMLEMQEAMAELPPELRRGPSWREAQRQLDLARRAFRDEAWTEGPGGPPWATGPAAEDEAPADEPGVLILLLEHARQRQALREIRQALQEARAALRQGDAGRAEQALSQADQAFRQADALRIARSLDEAEAALRRHDKQGALRALRQARQALRGEDGGSGGASRPQPSGATPPAAAGEAAPQAPDGATEGMGAAAPPGRR